jgi:vancomycin resistance protein VanJ
MPLTTTEPKPFTIACRCGERFHVDERSVGRRLECRCGRIITVGRPRRRRRDRIGAAARRLKSLGTAIVQTSRRLSRDAAGDRHRRSRRPVSRFERIAARTLTLLTWGYLASVCSIAVVMWTLADRWWFATILLFSGRWIFLVPLALLLPAAILVRRRLVWALVLAGLVVAGPVMGAHVGWRTLLPTPTGLPFRVVSFNADGGRGLAVELPIVLAAWEPDVVALQECGPDLALAVRAVAGWHHHIANELCFLSRYPIRDSSVMDRTALEALRNSAAGGIGGSGDVVRYLIATPSGDVQVTNLHLETPRKGIEGLDAFDIERLRENTRLRDIESDLARRWVDQGVAKRPVPVLVAGDFNTPVESRIFQAHWSEALQDAFSRVGRGLGMTKYNGWIRVRIDHVLAGPQWYVRRTGIGDDLESDHRPLIVDLVLPARSSAARDSTP